MATDGESSVATDAGPTMRRRSRADVHRSVRAGDTSSARGDSTARADAAAGGRSTDEPETDVGRTKPPVASEMPVPIPVVPVPVVVTPLQPWAPSPGASLAAGLVDELASQPGAVTGTPVVDAATAARVAPPSGSDLPAGPGIAAAGVAPAAPPAVPVPMVAAGSVDVRLVPTGDAPAATPESMRSANATGEQLAEVGRSSSIDPRGPDAIDANAVAAEAATIAAPTGTSPDPTLTVDAVRAGRPGIARAVRIGSGGNGEPAAATPAAADATGGHPVASVPAADEPASSAGSSHSTSASTPASTSTSAFAAAVAEAEASGAGSFDDAATTRAAAAATSADITGAHRSGARGLPVSVPSLSMDLSDEGLGPLTLQASNGAGMLHLKLTAGDRAVGELLARAGGELRRDIEAGGTVVGSLDIDHSGAHEPSTGHAGAGQWSSNQTGAGQHPGQADAGRSDGRTAARRDIPPTRSRVTSGSIGAPASSRTSSLNIGTAVDSVDVRI